MQYARGSHLILITLCFLMAASGGADAQRASQQQIDEGLHLLTFDRSELSSEERVTVLKIDARLYEFDIYCQSEHVGDPRRVSEWAEEFQLIAAINAGMYQEDLATSVGYLRTSTHVNNPSLNRNQAVFAASPQDTTLPAAQIIDRSCQDFDDLKDDYGVFLQSIRMVSCRQENVWAPQPMKWRMSVLATDRRGNILFIYTSIPYAVNEFIDYLLELPIDLYNAMYLEGGPAASLSLRFGENSTQSSHGESRAAMENLGGQRAIPNVLGIRRRGGAR